MSAAEVPVKKHIQSQGRQRAARVVGERKGGVGRRTVDFEARRWP